MGEKTFNLTWNNHLANLSGLFEGLYKSGSLTDTTLACQGGMLRAHRLVLAACSPYFERVFKEHYGDQPVLILKGVAVEEMECLLDFMYRGSIDVAEEHLSSLIKTATDLEIRGLSAEQKNEINHSPSNSRSRNENRTQRCHIETRVHTTEHRKETSSATSNSVYLKQPEREMRKDDEIKLEEIEDDPMLIEQDDSLDPLSTPETQIKRIPPPMFKRETRFKGQKRVSIGSAGRSLKGNDQSLDLKIKDCVSLRDTQNFSEDAYEGFEEVSLAAVKQEPTFNSGCTDPTVPTVQLNEDVFDQEQEQDDVDVESPSGDSTAKVKQAGGRKSGQGWTAGRRLGGVSQKAQYKPFSCDLCTLAFTRASHLARHRRVHTGERPFACTLCPRMFARQDKLKQHLDSHLQWPKRRALSSGHTGPATTTTTTTKGKRGRPRKIPSSEQTTMDMEDILKFGEFSSLLNKSQPANSASATANERTGARTSRTDSRRELPDDDEDTLYKNRDSYGCQVENGQDVE